MNQGSIFNCGFALVMNKRFISLFLLIFTLMGMMACQEKKAVSKQVKVELQRVSLMRSASGTRSKGEKNIPSTFFLCNCRNRFQ